MYRSRLFALALSTSLVVAAGCATTMAIRSMQPGRVFVGATKHIKLLEGQGRRSAREFVFMDLVSQARSYGYFSVEDRSEEGFAVRVAGRSVVVHGGENVLAPGEAGLRVDVLEWQGSRDMGTVRAVDENGVPYDRSVPVLRGDVLLAVTLFDHAGKTFLSEAEYQGVFSTYDLNVPREEVIERAASGALQRFLGDITPVQVTSQVRLDEEDEGQELILETARAGSIAQAAQDMRAYLDRNPLNSSAAYNLAVFLEAMGDYRAALEMYDKAMQLGGKDFYIGARAGCAQRLAGSEALEQGR